MRGVVRRAGHGQMRLQRACVHKLRVGEGPTRGIRGAKDGGLVKQSPRVCARRRDLVRVDTGSQQHQPREHVVGRGVHRARAGLARESVAAVELRGEHLTHTGRECSSFPSSSTGLSHDGKSKSWMPLCMRITCPTVTSAACGPKMAAMEESDRSVPDMALSTGSYFWAGSSRLSLPSSCSLSVSAAVNGLVPSRT